MRSLEVSYSIVKKHADFRQKWKEYLRNGTSFANSDKRMKGCFTSIAIDTRALSQKKAVALSPPPSIQHYYFIIKCYSEVPKNEFLEVFNRGGMW